MPRYVALIYGPAEQEGQGTAEDWAVTMADYTEFGEKAGAAGVLTAGEALQDTVTATTVHVEGGKGGRVIHTDGPFAETKEVLGGFYLLDCADLDDALSWAAQIPGAWHGKVEVRPVIEFADGA
ncbi:YciI family protein [soil metagenome]